MNRVGTVVRLAQGMLVARSPDGSTPDVGETVVDEALETVGRVVDVMGPVDRPYVVIDPSGDDTAALLNRRVYVR